MTRFGGIGGHQGARAGTETWLTPQPILTTLGPFDLDPCAAPTPRPWESARVHYTAPDQNGLLLPWFGRIWLNPPYGRTLPRWMARMAEHGQGTALIFARTETRTWVRHVWARADAILFVHGRLNFHKPDGSLAGNSGAPSALIAYGPEDVERLRESDIEGTLVPLTRTTMIYLALANPPTPSWAELVVATLRSLGGSASIRALYEALETHPKAKANRHWQAKIRQTVARVGQRTGIGQYELALAP